MLSNAEMDELRITELAKILNAELIGLTDAIRDTRYAIRSVSTDSRSTKPGDCFFAIPGPNFDGHDYIAEAFRKGAACAVVVAVSEPGKFPGKILLKVPDTPKALGTLAVHYRRQCSFKVIAITGSVGKTTTRHFIYHVLSRCFKCSQSPKNYNNQIGVPLSLLAARADDQIVIVELGANHPGEISYLAGITEPDIALVTNVTNAHLDGFGSIETIAAEKLAIARSLRNHGLLIINADSPHLLSAAKKLNSPFLTFGQADTADYHATNLQSNGLTAALTIDDTEIHIPLPGLANAKNALAAWAVCDRLGVTLDDFKAALKSLPALHQRTELLNLKAVTIINDCYNANPASMNNALDILARLGRTQNRRTVFICADMAELGKQARRLHARLGADIAEKKINLLLAVGPLAKIAAEAAEQNADYNIRTHCFGDTPSLCNNLHQFIENTDIILVKGSRIAGLETAIEKLKEIFSSSAD